MSVVATSRRLFVFFAEGWVFDFAVPEVLVSLAVYSRRTK